MAYSFELPNWLVIFTAEPMYIALWAVFGLFFSFVLVSFTLLILIRLLPTFPAVIVNFSVKVAEIIGYTFALTWMIGFMSMMILLFSGVSGIKMLLIWLTIFLGILLFCTHSYKKLAKFMDKRQGNADHT